MFNSCPSNPMLMKEKVNLFTSEVVFTKMYCYNWLLITTSY